MNTVSTDFKCRCGFKTKAHFKMPHVVEPTVIQISCSECATVWLLRIRRAPGTKGEVVVQPKIIAVSAILDAILKEEAELANAPVEE